MMQSNSLWFFTSETDAFITKLHPADWAEIQSVWFLS